MQLLNKKIKDRNNRKCVAFRFSNDVGKEILSFKCEKKSNKIAKGTQQKKINATRVKYVCWKKNTQTHLQSLRVRCKRANNTKLSKKK